MPLVFRTKACLGSRPWPPEETQIFYFRKNNFIPMLKQQRKLLLWKRCLNICGEKKQQIVMQGFLWFNLQKDGMSNNANTPHSRE